MAFLWTALTILSLWPCYEPCFLCCCCDLSVNGAYRAIAITLLWTVLSGLSLWPFYERRLPCCRYDPAMNRAFCAVAVTFLWSATGYTHTLTHTRWPCCGCDRSGRSGRRGAGRGGSAGCVGRRGRGRWGTERGTLCRRSRRPPAGPTPATAGAHPATWTPPSASAADPRPWPRWTGAGNSVQEAGGPDRRGPGSVSSGETFGRGASGGWAERCAWQTAPGPACGRGDMNWLSTSFPSVLQITVSLFSRVAGSAYMHTLQHQTHFCVKS